MLRQLLTATACGLFVITALGCSRVVSEINADNSRLVTTRVPGIKSNFNAVSASTGFDVTYTVSQKASVTIECSESAADYVDVYVKNGCLYIGLKESTRLKNLKLRATVAGPVLGAVTASSGADVKVMSPMSIKGGSLTLKASSGADIDISSSLSYTNVSATASSGADIDLDEVSATNISVTSSSGADIDIKALKAVSVSAASSSGADISLAGVTTNVNLTASSSGDISAKALNAKKGSAKASSGGDIECSVADLSMSKSSGGSIDNR